MSTSNSMMRLIKWARELRRAGAANQTVAEVVELKLTEAATLRPTTPTGIPTIAELVTEAAGA